MFQGLKNAVKRQKKLLVIFFLTIFLPSVVLSIFGIIALRNEKFRIEKQIENQQLQTANNIKERIGLAFGEIEEKLKILSDNPALLQKNHPAVKELLNTMFSGDSLVDIIFLVYGNEEPVFPVLMAGTEAFPRKSEPVPDTNLEQLIRNAEEAEYVRKDYQDAASIYNEAWQKSNNKTIRARMLNLKARNLVKAGKHREASEVYSVIINDHPEERTGSGLPLGLYAMMQKTECYNNLGDKRSAAGNDLEILQALLGNRWNLSQDQFNTYSFLVLENLAQLFSGNAIQTSELKIKYDEILKQYRNRMDQYKVINIIRSYIIPELKTSISSNNSSDFRFSKRVGNEDYLLLAVTLPEQNQQDNPDILAARVNNNYLQKNILNRIIAGMGLPSYLEIYITSLSGDTIKGSKPDSPEIISTTELFDNNFPPWRLEIYQTGRLGLGEIRIFSNFFFWTIITLIVILIFGAVLIARLVARDMEILKIRSDFVSSVSHEFKTPLTSMKALTERLGKGKVTDPEKFKQYISIITSDIDRLTRMVNNILSFSKIEEGKRVYKKETTDITGWLREITDTYKKENSESNLDLHTHIENDLPELLIDRDAMTQAIFNLLDNAIKFSGGKKEVEITAEAGGKSVIIRVRDKGIGIDDDERDKIFEKFYRGKNAVKYLITGTGLGLALVRHTIETHGGHIEAGRETGWSTVFTITLPVPDKN